MYGAKNDQLTLALELFPDTLQASQSKVTLCGCALLSIVNKRRIERLTAASEHRSRYAPEKRSF